MGGRSPEVIALLGVLAAWGFLAAVLATACSIGREPPAPYPYSPSEWAALNERKNMKTLKLPGLSPAFSQLLLHAVIVGLAVFGAQVVTNAAGVTSIATLLVILDSAAGAGVTAIIHFGLGLIPTPAASSISGRYTAGVTLKIPSKIQQVLWSLLVVWLVTFGGAVAAGAVHATSVPTLWALVLSAGAAGVTAVVQAIVRLIPIPSPIPSPLTGGSH